MDSLNWCAGERSNKKGSCVESILKIQETVFANGPDMECEKKREIKDDFKVWRLRNTESMKNHL